MRVSAEEREGAGPPVRSPQRLLPPALLALAAVYLVVVAIQANEVIASVYRDADAASAPVIGQLFGGSPAHRDVILGQMLWLSTLGFELLTRWLPAHREIWEAAPWAMALASVCLLGWGSARAFGRWAGAVTATIVACASPHTLHLLSSLNDHSPTWFSLALIAAALVPLQRRRPLRRLPTAIAIAVVGIVVGVNMASDELLIVAGLLPALVAVLLTWALRPGRDTALALWCALATAAAAVAAGALIRVWAHHESVMSPAAVSHTSLVAVKALGSNFELWWQSVIVLGNGGLIDQTFGFATALELVCAGLSLIAVALIPCVAWLELRRAIGDRRSPTSDQDAARICWCAFWSVSAVLLTASFIATSNPVDIESDRYLVGLIYAAAALVPGIALAHHARRVAIMAATAFFALTAIAQAFERDAIAEAEGLPSHRMAAEVAAIAHRERLSFGYAGYWDAAPITWATQMGVEVFPVQDCATRLCPYDLHAITSWYAPKAARTFLLSDPTLPGAAQPTSNLGRPAAVYEVGPAKMYVYAYDIAARFGGGS